jgi:hypothetical protein
VRRLSFLVGLQGANQLAVAKQAAQTIQARKIVAEKKWRVAMKKRISSGEIAAEFLGSMFLVMAAISPIILFTEVLESHISVALIANAIAVAFILATLIEMFGSISGVDEKNSRSARDFLCSFTNRGRAYGNFFRAFDVLRIRGNFFCFENPSRRLFFGNNLHVYFGFCDSHARKNKIGARLDYRGVSRRGNDFGVVVNDVRESAGHARANVYKLGRGNQPARRNNFHRDADYRDVFGVRRL